jgi:ATP-dependent DNA helicase RecG
MSSPETKTSPLAAPARRDEAGLRRPVSAVWGVGEERAKLLARLGIFTVEDLLLHKPRRYEDRRKFLPIRDLKLKEAATVRGTIIAAGVKRFRKGARAMFECVFDDGTAHLHCRWWQAQPWMEDWYAVGREFLIFGKPDSLKPRNMEHPETEFVEAGEDEFIHVNRIEPIHPLTDGMTARVMRTLVWRALEKFETEIMEPMIGVWPSPATAIQSSQKASGKTKDHLNLGVAALGDGRTPLLPARANAVRMIHFPNELTDVEIARQRLALDEFVALQFQIQSRRKKFETLAKALPCGGDNHLMKPFLAELGFKLTAAQTNVLREIRADLNGAHPMRRLLQGDVGSGKTAVAACAALMTLESGFNVALMAPTEILAEQHFRNFQKWFEPLGVRVELQTGSIKTFNVQHSTSNAQREVRGKPSTFNLQPSTLFIGTHALFTAAFELPKLGLVIIDEQHKFGVAQRETLVRKGNYPHLLVMTATPIPRTLGLTLYGDLDVSVIDELPDGRGAIKTFVRPADKLPKVWDFIREKISAGRQAFVVYPRVEENADGLKAVTKEFEHLKNLLTPFKVGLLHGRLKGFEKENVMAEFRANKSQMLLATSLIEVGVDVPNATVMLIENAEAFGLAQLHQLRGRIGRGAHESFCILISDARSPDSIGRLKILAESNDGFKIAEADLKLRGPGELLGQQQSGLPNLRFGNLAEDLSLIRQARELVRKVI